MTATCAADPISKNHVALHEELLQLKNISSQKNKESNGDNLDPAILEHIQKHEAEFILEKQLFKSYNDKVLLTLKKQPVKTVSPKLYYNNTEESK